MLTQLTKLAETCDGRYGSDSELEFLHNYLNEVEQRINLYEKLRDNEDQIIQQIEANLKCDNPKIFEKNGQDFSSICERDRKHTMRFLATAMLFNEQDKLRNSLLWQRIIMTVFNNAHSSKMTYKMMEQVMNGILNKEEMDLIDHPLKLVQSLLR